jgi:hypothetical protein
LSPLQLFSSFVILSCEIKKDKAKHQYNNWSAR